MTMIRLTERDRRALRLGAVVVAAYLVLFFGWRGVRHLEQRRAAYQSLVIEAQRWQTRTHAQARKLAQVRQLEKQLHLDLRTLDKTTVVAKASAAIQRAASAGGIKLTSMHEVPGHATGRQLAAIQLEGMGPVAAVMGLLPRLQTLGYPVLVDSVQLDRQPQPGQVKFSLTLIVLDFEAWQQPEAPHV